MALVELRMQGVLPKSQIILQIVDLGRTGVDKMQAGGTWEVVYREM